MVKHIFIFFKKSFFAILLLFFGSLVQTLSAASAAYSPVVEMHSPTPRRGDAYIVDGDGSGSLSPHANVSVRGRIPGSGFRSVTDTEYYIDNATSPSHRGSTVQSVPSGSLERPNPSNADEDDVARDLDLEFSRIRLKTEHFSPVNDERIDQDPVHSSVVADYAARPRSSQAVNNEEEQNQCPICLDEIDNKYPETLATRMYTNCNHGNLIHAACAQEWVNNNPEARCPICRAEPASDIAKTPQAMFKDFLRKLIMAYPEQRVIQDFKALKPYINEKDVSINLRETSSHNTALHYAVSKNYCDLIHLLLTQKEININMANRLGFTPLAIAINQTGSKAVALLSNAGADINSSLGRSKDTLLHIAVKRRNISFFRNVLLAPHVDLSKKNILGLTAFDLAVQGDLWLMVGIFLQEVSKKDILINQILTAENYRILRDKAYNLVLNHNDSTYMNYLIGDNNESDMTAKWFRDKCKVTLAATERLINHIKMTISEIDGWFVAKPTTETLKKIAREQRIDIRGVLDANLFSHVLNKLKETKKEAKNKKINLEAIIKRLEKKHGGCCATCCW